MQNICPNLTDNTWNYRVVNNILLFTKGPLSQWWGYWKDQDHPFSLDLSQISTIYNHNNKTTLETVDKFFDYFDTPEREFVLNFVTAEQAMMFGKAVLFEDFDMAEKILLEVVPAKQKELGRKIKNFDSEVWDSTKITWVELVTLSKFSKHEDLRAFLTKTCKNYIIAEAAPWDKVWGIGLPYDDSDAWNVDTWKGENLLGRALMRVRERLS